MGSLNFSDVVENRSNAMFRQSRANSLLDQLLVKPEHQPLDLQLGLGSLRSTTTLLAPNRLLVQTVVDLNRPITHPQNHNILANHFLFRPQNSYRLPSVHGSTGWPNVGAVQNYEKVDDGVRVSNKYGQGLGGGRPIALGLFPEGEARRHVDDGRLHSLATGVNGVYECPTCRVEFYSRYTYAAHVRVHHDSETRQERRMRLHNKYMSKMARRRRKLLRTWTLSSRRNTSASASASASLPNCVPVKIEPQLQ